MKKYVAVEQPTTEMTAQRYAIQERAVIESNPERERVTRWYIYAVPELAIGPEETRSTGLRERFRLKRKAVQMEGVVVRSLIRDA